MKVLIVDDAMVIRTLNRRILVDYGISNDSFIEAENGESALQIATSVDIDLFLVDWNMPKLDGLSFLKCIRSMDKYKDTPVIMITSEAAKYNVLEAIEAGVTNYIVKPIKADMLLKKLKPYLKVGVTV